MTDNVVQFQRQTFGATADEWLHFEMVVGAADLLPVVSNPAARISEASTLKGKGKTPSVYNAQRRVVGIPKWTQLHATPAQVDQWGKVPDYGICIQCRRVRGLDIDVPDQELADAIGLAFLNALAEHLELTYPFPHRTRPGIGKQLLAFVVEGELTKRHFKVEGGLVEFLANGQQFIAVGEHFDGKGEPTGTRYGWASGLPYVFPVIPQAAFEAAWKAIVDEFALEPEVSGGEGSDRTRPDLEGIEDPVAEYLDVEGLVTGTQGEKLFVDCPWKDGHSSDSGVSETAWLVAGSKGFERGHFQCLHASCQGRKDEDFLDAIGFRTAAFRNLDAEDGGAEPSGGPVTMGDEVIPWPKFGRDGKGAILPVIGNVVLALARPDIVGVTLRFDEFRDELQIDGRSFGDADAAELRRVLEVRGFKPVGRELLRDALLIHQQRHRYDSAQEWLQALPAWDGVERVETFYSRLCAVEDTAYTRAVARYTWTALAGRVTQPGIKADMVVILQGDQGLRKSSVVEAISPPALDAFRELNLHQLDADLSRKLRGCLVGELAELRGLRTKDAESIKAWIVQRHERWVPKWMERETAFPRRCVLFGTSNPHELLDDETGERRWLPMAVTGPIDTAAVAAERDQLWAEGLVRFELLGIEWQDAERLARGEHEKFKVRDAWVDVIRQWLNTPNVAGVTPHQEGFTSVRDVAEGSLGLSLTQLRRPEELRIGKALRALGWRSGTARRDDGVAWGWVRKPS